MSENYLITSGKNYLKIEDINKLNYLTVVLNRLIEVEGQIEIVRKRIPLGEEILIEDVNGNSQLRGGGLEFLELCDIVITFGQCGVSKQGLVLKMAKL